MESVFQIIDEDEALLVVNKRKPFLSQRADRGSKEGFYEFVARTVRLELFPVHRLDREVLGLMLFAKSKKMATLLSNQFRKRGVKKGYEAFVTGRVPAESGALIHYLKKNHRTNYVTVFPRPAPGAKHAELIYKVMERTGNHTRLFIRLITGRSHQIRAQLAKEGFSIVGDTRYGEIGCFKGEGNREKTP